MSASSSEFAFNTHQVMENNSVKLSFSGDFSPELITVLLLMAKKNIGARSVMKKVYNIMIECLENLTKHAVRESNDKHSAIFLLGQDDNFLYLSTGNKIHKKDVPSLKQKLEKTNSLNKDGLRDWYNDILVNTATLNEKGGAGLGIIDMALKSGNPLFYEFQEIDDQFDFFTIKIKVNDTH